MNRSRTVAIAGAAAALALCGAAAVALGSGAGGELTAGDRPALIGSTASDDPSTLGTTESTVTFESGVTAKSTAESTAESTATAGPGIAEPAGGIGIEAATRIALDRTGGGHVTGIERELEHGRMEWKIEITAGSRSWDVRIDAATGAVTRFRAEDSGGGHGGGDDHGGDDDRGGNSGRG